jgi:hypothetical protein
VIEDDYDAEALGQLTLARFIDSGGLARHLRRVHLVYRARRDCLLAALGTHLPRIRPQGEAAGLHLLLRLPARQDPGVICTAAETHRIMLESGVALGRSGHGTAGPAHRLRLGPRGRPRPRNRIAPRFQLSRDPSAREVITPLWHASPTELPPSRNRYCPVTDPGRASLRDRLESSQ